MNRHVAHAELAYAPVVHHAQPRVTVVMVVFWTGEALEESIRHVLADPLVDEFIIVDNGSPPDQEEMLRALGRREPRVILIQGHGNVGFARGANRGARAARGETLVFVNPDAFLQRNCVKMLVQALKGRPSPSIAGACVLNADGAEQRGGRRGEVTAITTLLSFAHLTSAFAKLKGFEIHREHEALPRSVTQMPTISGACFAARRTDFLSLGGFDEGYFLHVEDIDLCWRARRMGGEVLFQPRAKVVHLGHTSLEHPVRVEFHKGVGLARYFMKRADKPHRLVLATVLAPLIMLTAVVRPALWKITGRPI